MCSESNPKAYNVLLDVPSIQAAGFSQGLKFYFACSYFDVPYVGRSFYSLSNGRAGSQSRPYLFNLDQVKVFKDTSREREPHQLGEVWGSAFWELRKKFGKEKSDKLVFAAWLQLKPDAAGMQKPDFYVNAFLDANKAHGNAQDSNVIREAFVRRKL
jgi:hypothetical protein